MTNSIQSDLYMTPKTGLSTTTMIQGRDASELGMEDFFNLLVAQMTNQDMLNPTNDTEFIAQMAQFSALKGIQTIQEYQLSSYATSYVGKSVKIAQADESDGKLKTIEGVVDSVTFYDGTPRVLVGGKAYDLHTVMEVVGTAPSGTGGGSSGVVTLSEASGYIGKIVQVAYTDSAGTNVKKEGVVASAILQKGVAHVMIDGTSYPANAIVHVRERDNEPSEDEV